MKVPQKIKNRTIIQSSNSTPGYLSEENKNSNSKRYMYPNVTAALFTIAKIWIQLKCPLIDEWIKMWCIHRHTHTQWNVSHDQELNIAIFDNMDEPIGYYVKGNKSDRER